jgi:hypothetical protein
MPLCHGIRSQIPHGKHFDQFLPGKDLYQRRVVFLHDTVHQSSFSVDNCRDF